MKTCTKCKIEKSLDEFRPSKLTKDGKQSWCKDCTRIGLFKESQEVLESAIKYLNKYKI